MKTGLWMILFILLPRGITFVVKTIINHPQNSHFDISIFNFSIIIIYFLAFYVLLKRCLTFMSIIIFDYSMISVALSLLSNQSSKTLTILAAVLPSQYFGIFPFLFLPSIMSVALLTMLSTFKSTI